MEEKKSIVLYSLGSLGTDYSQKLYKEFTGKELDHDLVQIGDRGLGCQYYMDVYAEPCDVPVEELSDLVEELDSENYVPEKAISIDDWLVSIPGYETLYLSKWVGIVGEYQVTWYSPEV